MSPSKSRVLKKIIRDLPYIVPLIENSAFLRGQVALQQQVMVLLAGIYYPEGYNTIIGTPARDPANNTSIGASISTDVVAHMAPTPPAKPSQDTLIGGESGILTVF